MTHHRVDGIGRQVTYNNEKPLDPRVYERAIHGLQEIVIKTTQNNSTPTKEQYSSPHEEIVEDGEKRIQIAEDTTLHKVCHYFVPPNWDVSVLTDNIRDHGYAVRASVSCGGEITVLATIFIENDSIRRLDIGHHTIHDPTEFAEVKSISPAESARKIALTNRWLENSVTYAYAKTIPSAATAFDYIATKKDIGSHGPRPASHRDRYETANQNEWAIIRGKTKQTVSDNVRSARDNLLDLPELNAFEETRPALRKLDENSEYKDMDIRLV